MAYDLRTSAIPAIANADTINKPNILPEFGAPDTIEALRDRLEDLWEQTAVLIAQARATDVRYPERFLWETLEALNIFDMSHGISLPSNPTVGKLHGDYSQPDIPLRPLVWNGEDWVSYLEDIQPGGSMLDVILAPFLVNQQVVNAGNQALVNGLRTELRGGVAEARDTLKKLSDVIDAIAIDTENLALTGVPTAPTAAPGTNSTQLATTAFVSAAVAALIGGAPATLDTLNEIAAALANDANLAATLTTAIAGKQAQITGADGQYVGFDGSGNAVAKTLRSTAYGNLLRTVSGGALEFAASDILAAIKVRTFRVDDQAGADARAKIAAAVAAASAAGGGIIEFTRGTVYTIGGGQTKIDILTDNILILLNGAVIRLVSGGGTMDATSVFNFSGSVSDQVTATSQSVYSNTATSASSMSAYSVGDLAFVERTSAVGANGQSQQHSVIGRIVAKSGDTISLDRQIGFPLGSDDITRTIKKITPLRNCGIVCDGGRFEIVSGFLAEDPVVYRTAVRAIYTEHFYAPDLQTKGPWNRSLEIYSSLDPHVTKLDASIDHAQIIPDPSDTLNEAVGLYVNSVTGGHFADIGGDGAVTVPVQFLYSSNINGVGLRSNGSYSRALRVYGCVQSTFMAGQVHGGALNGTSTGLSLANGTRDCTFVGFWSSGNGAGGSAGADFWLNNGVNINNTFIGGGAIGQSSAPADVSLGATDTGNRFIGFTVRDLSRIDDQAADTQWHNLNGVAVARFGTGSAAPAYRTERRVVGRAGANGDELWNHLMYGKDSANALVLMATMRAIYEGGGTGAQNARFDWRILRNGTDRLAAQLNDGFALDGLGNAGVGMFNGRGYFVNDVQVLAARQTGFAALSGASRKTTFSVYGGHTAAGSYDQSIMQAVIDALKNTAERVKALDDALLAHGITGA